MKRIGSFLSRHGVWIALLIYFLIFAPDSVVNAQVISPRISITSSQDPSGIILNIKGMNFSGGSMATLYAKNPDGSQAAVQNMNISKEGTFNLSHLFPAGYLPGTYILWVVDDSTGKYSNRINFNMQATKSTDVRTASPPTYSPLYTPKHGDLIRSKEDAKVYLVQGIQQGIQRRAIETEEVFRQMGFRKSDVKDLDQQQVMSIPEGPPIWSKELITSFPDGTLIRLKGKSQTYVIQGGKKCYIPDPETFQSRGYSWDQVKEVDQATLDSIFTGIPIQSVKPPYQYTPPGQTPSTQPPPISSTTPYQTQPQVPPLSSPSTSQPYGSSTTQQGTGSTPYQTQPQSSVTSFPNGTLVKGSGPNIYLIENGAKRLIPDMETFNAMGFNWGSIINLDDQKLGNVPMGIPFPKQRTK